SRGVLKYGAPFGAIALILMTAGRYFTGGPSCIRPRLTTPAPNPHPLLPATTGATRPVPDGIAAALVPVRCPGEVSRPFPAHPGGALRCALPCRLPARHMPRRLLRPVPK